MNQAYQEASICKEMKEVVDAWSTERSLAIAVDTGDRTEPFLSFIRVILACSRSPSISQSSSITLQSEIAKSSSRAASISAVYVSLLSNTQLVEWDTSMNPPKYLCFPCLQYSSR